MRCARCGNDLYFGRPSDPRWFHEETRSTICDLKNVEGPRALPDIELEQEVLV